MRPDASRDEIVACLRGLAGLIYRNLPRRVQVASMFLPWDVTAPLLLARIARQGETLALLIEHGHEVDAEMIMRSTLEHLILFAWLAIEPDDPSRTWRARDPAQNTEWWMVDQFRRDKAATEDRMQHLPGFDEADVRKALRRATNHVKTLPAHGEFPNVLQRAEEVDLHWAHRLDGWQTARPGEPGFTVTFRGHYWTLYSRGSTSVHPDYGAIRRFTTPPSPHEYQRHRVTLETPQTEVSVVLSITVFLLGDAIAVADAALGWDAYDEALRILQRWEEVRAPDYLLNGARRVLGRRRRSYARTGDDLLRLEMTRREFSVTVVHADGGWWRLRHPLGTREWSLDNEGGQVRQLNPGTGFELGPVVMRAVEMLADAAELPRKPKAWPTEELP